MVKEKLINQTRDNAESCCFCINANAADRRGYFTLTSLENFSNWVGSKDAMHGAVEANQLVSSKPAKEEVDWSGLTRDKKCKKSVSVAEQQ